MNVRDILCASDLSLASDKAVSAAAMLAERLGSKVTLLHVLNKDERDAAGKESVLQRMQEQSEKSGGALLITHKLLEGDFMKQIAEETARDHGLLVVGTHGARGLRQTLLGADILKLVRHSAVPSLVVQEETDLQGLLGKIVLPVAAHSDIEKLLSIIVSLSKVFASEVHIFQLMRPREEPSQELLDNKLTMMQYFEEAGVRHKEANVPSTTFSIGFAEATIRYAEEIGAGAIAMMCHASAEYRYIADAEKERLLANDARIPILTV